MKSAPRCACGNAAVLTSGEEVYPHRHDLWARSFWLCRPCHAYVGCHPGTDRPLGNLAGPALRLARMRAHGALDPLWKHGRMSRNKVYKQLSRKLGREVHVGQSNEAQCEEIIKACQEMAAKLEERR